MASPALPLNADDTAGESAFVREPRRSSPLSVIVSLSMAATGLSLLFAGVLSLIVWGIAG